MARESRTQETRVEYSPLSICPDLSFFEWDRLLVGVGGWCLCHSGGLRKRENRRALEFSLQQPRDHSRQDPRLLVCPSSAFLNALQNIVLWTDLVCGIRHSSLFTDRLLPQPPYLRNIWSPECLGWSLFSSQATSTECDLSIDLVSV